MNYVLHNIPATTETPDKLVKFLARYAGFLIEKLGGYPEFHVVLASSRREDFFKVFCRCVKAGEGEAPWTDAEWCFHHGALLLIDLDAISGLFFPEEEVFSSNFIMEN